jgi:hypothetical protein
MNPNSLVAATVIAFELSASVSCRPHANRTHARNTDPPDERGYICLDSDRCGAVMGSAPEDLGKARFVLVSCRPEHRRETIFRASWTTNGASPHLFEWTGVAHEYDVVPLHGEVVRLAMCSNGTLNAQSGHGDYAVRPGSSAVFEVGPPAFAWAAPAPGHVFVPLQGEATLDHDWQATAVFEPPVEGFPDPSVTLFLAEVHKAEFHQLPNLYLRVRAGETFEWGNRKATIVRIVEPRVDVFGWAEVALNE